ncbi:DUF2487 family protein [Paenibacillus alkalitolerans]|uniref:DUF2487 family protein n=1 Tax=Paenibacillus alkalitolerans TaxID=2799335 RepID=UPI0018F28711|nr:DUF2487 family protein [Paenibacillus alkalitolerans]
MKFSDIERDRWEELKPYFDTAILPVSGMTGREQPWEATEALERLRDALDPIEQMFKGRVVIYPAVHYSESEEHLKRLVEETCRRLKACGFRHCVVVTGSGRLSSFGCEEASLVIAPPGAEEEADSGSGYRTRVRQAVEALWASGGTG